MTTEKRITDVQQSETYSLFTELKNKGYDVDLRCSFCYTYDKDSSYLSIEVKNIADTTALFKCVNKESFDILLAKYADQDDTIFEIRQTYDNKELITQEVWMQYYKG